MAGAAATDSIPAGTDAVSAYLREIGRIRLPTSEQERAWMDRIGRGDESARFELIAAHLKLVISICRQFRDQGLPFADLVGEGNLGLVRAARSFGGTHARRFAGYAEWWIRNRIRTALEEQARFLAFPEARPAAWRDPERRHPSQASKRGFPR